MVTVDGVAADVTILRRRGFAAHAHRTLCLHALRLRASRHLLLHLLLTDILIARAALKSAFLPISLPSSRTHRAYPSRQDGGVECHQHALTAAEKWRAPSSVAQRMRRAARSTSPPPAFLCSGLSCYGQWTVAHNARAAFCEARKGSGGGAATPLAFSKRWPYGSRGATSARDVVL